MITVPVFISHYSGRPFEPKLRWWLDGYDDRADMIMASPSQSVPATWKPYDVTEQPPIRVRVPDRPFVGALNLSLRDPENHRFAVNYVNVVVRPDKPPARAEVELGTPNDALLRFAPEDFAKQSWTRVGFPPAGKAYGFGKGYLEYRVKVPEAVVKAGIETIRLQLEMSAKAERQKVDWPERKSKQDYPQTDGDGSGRRTWRSRSTGRLSIARRSRTTRPTRRACCRTWRGLSTEATASWSRPRCRPAPRSVPRWPRAGRWSSAWRCPTRPSTRAASASTGPRRAATRSTRR